MRSILLGDSSASTSAAKPTASASAPTASASAPTAPVAAPQVPVSPPAAQAQTATSPALGPQTASARPTAPPVTVLPQTATAQPVLARPVLAPPADRPADSLVAVSPPTVQVQTATSPTVGPQAVSSRPTAPPVAVLPQTATAQPVLARPVLAPPTDGSAVPQVAVSPQTVSPQTADYKPTSTDPRKDPTLRAELWQPAFFDGWSKMPEVAVETWSLRCDAPKAVTIRVAKPTIKTIGFDFPESPAASWLTKAPEKPAAPAAGGGGGQGGADNVAADAASVVAAEVAAAFDPSKLTRIKPPGDIIKLEDRLYYVLQPPLQMLVSSGDVHVPFEPFPYQYEGIGFLYPRYTAVLADEMGLGKTMQAIMSVRLLLRAGEVKNVLLVCPKPLVSNWKREFALWAPEVPLGIIEGDQAKRHWQWRQPNIPVKLANYELLMRDRDLLDENLHFDLVVLDEAQRIKNKSSTTSQIVRSISRTRSWAMTGTPVENSPEDLVGIFEFLSPGFLRTDMQAKKMGLAVKDHILRRTKDMVLTDMPPKMFRDAEVDLTPEQYETYKRAEEEGIWRLNEMGEGVTVQHVFELVLRLKQICNFDPMTGASCKLERLEADLEEVAASGQKAILFSQWVVTIERLRERLKRFGTLEYHGKMPHKQREGVIDQFKNDPSKHLIMMSYGAGSVGLNLQFCRYVFLFDRWWNPAIEDQAVNRAHRIGAAGSVTVTRMLVTNSIEERINKVLEEKRELFNSILSHTDAHQTSGLTQKEIFGLFNLKVQPRGKHAA